MFLHAVRAFSACAAMLTAALTLALPAAVQAQCPPGAPADQCMGNVRGSAGLGTGCGWVRVGGPTVCSSNFGVEHDLDRDGTNDSVYNDLNILFQISNDDVKADRQNHLIVVMYNPTR